MRPESDSAAPARRRGGIRETVVLVVIAIGLALLVKSLFVQAFYIPSASMENTLQGGDPITMQATSAHPFDRVLVNKFAYHFHGPHRGDIVVFSQPPGWPDLNPRSTSSDPVVRFIHRGAAAIGLAPSGSTDYIKRVIGLPGDRVVCCNAHHQITVNGHALVEPYIDLQDEAHSQAFRPFTETVPKGDVWVMGDHRDDSSDSRDHGPVPISHIIGRASLVIWPFKDWTHLSKPATFRQPGLS